MIELSENLLPCDGEVLYYGSIFSKPEADAYYTQLLDEIEWIPDEIMMFGKLIITKRKVAWYGDAGISYTYSKKTKTALAWTPLLLNLKALVEAKSGTTYNSCLLNLYHEGKEGMGWHSDDEKEMLKNGAIASVSFGAERKFAFKHRTQSYKTDILLHHGSLLVMKGSTQAHWLHRLPPSAKIKTPRINLTFRTIINT